MGNVDLMKFNLLGKGNSHSLINSNHRLINEYHRISQEHRNRKIMCFVLLTLNAMTHKSSQFCLLRLSKRVEFFNLESKGHYPFTAGILFVPSLSMYVPAVYVNITHYTCVQYFRRDFLSPWFPQYGNTCQQTMTMNKDDNQQAATVNGEICHKK